MWPIKNKNAALNNTTTKKVGVGLGSGRGGHGALGGCPNKTRKTDFGKYVWKVQNPYFPDQGLKGCTGSWAQPSTKLMYYDVHPLRKTFRAFLVHFCRHLYFLGPLPGVQGQFLAHRYHGRF